MFYGINYNYAPLNNLVLPGGRAQLPNLFSTASAFPQAWTRTSPWVLDETQVSAQGLNSPPPPDPTLHLHPFCPSYPPGVSNAPTRHQPDSSTTSEIAFQAVVCQTTRQLPTSLPWLSRKCSPVPLSPCSTQEGCEWCHKPLTASFKCHLSQVSTLLSRWEGQCQSRFQSSCASLPSHHQALTESRRAGNLSASASRAALAPCRELVGLPCGHPHCSSRDGLPKHAGLVKLHAGSPAQPTAQHRQCPQILPPQEPGLDPLGLATQALSSGPL